MVDGSKEEATAKQGERALEEDFQPTEEGGINNNSNTSSSSESSSNSDISSNWIDSSDSSVAGSTSRRVSSMLSHISVVFFQAVSQYQKIQATTSTKQYGMNAGLKVFGDEGLDTVSSEIRDNLHGRGVVEPVRQECVTHHI